MVKFREIINMCYRDFKIEEDFDKLSEHEKEFQDEVSNAIAKYLKAHNDKRRR